MLNIDDVLKNVEIEFAKIAAKQKGVEWDGYQKPITSRQIKALAKVLVDEINHELMLKFATTTPLR